MLAKFLLGFLVDHNTPVCYNKDMKILSLDLSTKSSGYAVISNGLVIEFGTIKPDQRHDFLHRGRYTAEFVRLLREKHGKFDHVVIEELKVSRNPKTLTMLAIVQGMVIQSLWEHDFWFVAPTVWRKHFGLNGTRQEAKEGAIALTRNKLGMNTQNDDEAEAVLIGIYFSSQKG